MYHQHGAVGGQGCEYGITESPQEEVGTSWRRDGEVLNISGSFFGQVGADVAEVTGFYVELELFLMFRQDELFLDISCIW